MDDLSIEFNPAGPDDHVSSPNLISPGSTADSLNPALHGLMANVGKLSLDRHVVTPELFWPSPSDTMSISLPLWENLREMHVLMSMSAPDGGRYLVFDRYINGKSSDEDEDDNENDDGDEGTGGDEGEGSDDEDSDGYVYESETSSVYHGEPTYTPVPERMNPLLVAMARAARHAPRLEKMRLGVPSGLYSTYFDVWYIAKGVYSHHADEPVGHARVIWQVGDWRPVEEVERHWRDAMSSDGVMLYNVDRVGYW